MVNITAEAAYPTPFAHSPFLPLLLISLATQKNAPKTATKFSDEYDYIIVGAGSAGSVVASRLSEVPCIKVLLLEAGKSPPLLNDIPAMDRNFWFTDIDWAYKTVPQKHSGFGLVNNQVIWPSGKGLGGSSLLNAMLYVRGNSKNYDDWARNGAEGWSYSEVLPYFKKMEDQKDRAYLEDGYHGVGGPITVSTPSYNPEVKKAILKATKQMGDKVVDPNGRRQTGFYIAQITARNGQRCSTAKGYLVPAENRTNLDIVSNAFVKKVLMKGNRAVGVEFEKDNKTFQVRARREVILSAGTTNTAQLLMLSGIGPRKHLKEFNIPLVADLPVGDNMQDHWSSPLFFQLSSKLQSREEKTASNETIEEYIKERSGLLSASVSVMAFLNGTPTCSPDFPNYELYLGETILAAVKPIMGVKPEIYEELYARYEKKPVYICLAQILQPKSRGTVRLQSADPYDPPLIDPNYYGDPSDIQSIVEGLKECIRIGKSKPLRKIGSKLLNPGCTHMSKHSDKYFECLARNVVVSMSHQVGVAKMGDPDDSTTVVDPQLKVKGAEGLRVIDASVMPTVPSGNTNVPTIMLAEKASDILKSTIDCSA